MTNAVLATVSKTLIIFRLQPPHLLKVTKTKNLSQLELQKLLCNIPNAVFSIYKTTLR